MPEDQTVSRGVDNDALDVDLDTEGDDDGGEDEDAD